MKIYNSPELFKAFAGRKSTQTAEASLSPSSMDYRNNALARKDTFEETRGPLMSNLQRVINRFVDDIEEYQTDIIQRTEDDTKYSGRNNVGVQGELNLVYHESVKVPVNPLQEDQVSLTLVSGEGNKPGSFPTVEVDKIADKVTGDQVDESSPRPVHGGSGVSGSSLEKAITTVFNKIGEFVKDIAGIKPVPDSMPNASRQGVDSTAASDEELFNSLNRNVESGKFSPGPVSLSGVVVNEREDSGDPETAGLVRMSYSMGKGLRESGISEDSLHALKRIGKEIANVFPDLPSSLVADQSREGGGAGIVPEQMTDDFTGVHVSSVRYVIAERETAIGTSSAGVPFESISSRGNTVIPTGNEGPDTGSEKVAGKQHPEIPPFIGGENRAGKSRTGSGSEVSKTIVAGTDPENLQAGKSGTAPGIQQGFAGTGFGDDLGERKVSTVFSTGTAGRDAVLVDRVARFVDEINVILGRMEGTGEITGGEAEETISGLVEMIRHPVSADTKQKTGSLAGQSIMGKIFSDKMALEISEQVGIDLRKDGLLQLNAPSLVSRLSSDREETVSTVKDFGTMLSQRIDYFANPFLSLYMDDKNILQLRGAQKDEEAAMAEKELDKEQESLQKKLNELRLLIERSQLLKEWFSGAGDEGVMISAEPDLMGE